MILVFTAVALVVFMILLGTLWVMGDEPLIISEYNGRCSFCNEENLPRKGAVRYRAVHPYDYDSRLGEWCFCNVGCLRGWVKGLK